MTGWVLGVDSGGSGLRIALAHAGEAPHSAEEDCPAPLQPVGRVHTATPVPTGPSGIDPAGLLERLVPAAQELLAETAGADHVDAACVGAAGMATLGDGLRADLPAALEQALGVRHLALAADAVTGYAAALGDRPGVVVAAGTGLIALGTDLREWRRADGWGQLLGDCGGGAWIGRAGLEAALRAHDGRRGGSSALLARAEERYAPAAELPGWLYPRTDRPAALASFAPEVARLAAASEQVAVTIMSTAAEEIAHSAVAALPSVADAEIALTGGLLELGEPLLGPLRARLAERLPHTVVTRATAAPLGGALRVGAALLHGRLRLPAEGRLLTVF